MFPTLARRLISRTPIAPKLRNVRYTPPPPPPPSRPTNPYLNSRYKPKKVWPPDFSRLSAKEQFRLERRYKRRAKLATARPRWDKYVRLAQLTSITFVLVYSLLFMDWNVDDDKQPFQFLRRPFWRAIDAILPARRPVPQTPDLPTTADSK